MKDFIILDESGSAYSVSPVPISGINDAFLERCVQHQEKVNEFFPIEVTMPFSQMTGEARVEPAIASMQGYPIFLNKDSIIVIKGLKCIKKRQDTIIFDLRMLPIQADFIADPTDNNFVVPKWSVPSLGASAEILFSTTLMIDFCSLGRKIFPDNPNSISSFLVSVISITEDGLTEHNSEYSVFAYPQNISYYFGCKKEPTFFPLLPNVFEDFGVCLGTACQNLDIPSGFSGVSTELSAAKMLLYFLRSSFNADLISINANQGRIKLIPKLCRWDRQSLKYSPSIETDELEKYASLTASKKWFSDAIKTTL